MRRRLGRFEEPAAEAYRRPFINLDDLADTLRRIPGVATILEVGAGEGAVATRLTRVFPEATYLGIDLIDKPGRLFRGDHARAEFVSTAVHRVDADRLFDLVVLVDVLHHVPLAERHQVLAHAHARVKLGGHLVIKEWETSRSAAQAAWFVVDRLVGGDPNVRSFAPGELEAMVGEVCADGHIVIEGRVPPRRNNLLLVVERGWRGE